MSEDINGGINQSLRDKLDRWQSRIAERAENPKPDPGPEQAAESGRQEAQGGDGEPETPVQPPQVKAKKYRLAVVFEDDSGKTQMLQKPDAVSLGMQAQEIRLEDSRTGDALVLQPGFSVEKPALSNGSDSSRVKALGKMAKRSKGLH